MKQYYDLLQELLDTGNDSDDRTGTGTLSLFGKHLEYDLKEGFPLLTGKFISFKMVAAELLWMLSGSINNNDLKKFNGNDKDTIWQEWCTEDGNLSKIYGHQWRNWNGNIYDRLSGEDQFNNLIQGLKERPFSRRHIISAWNATDLPDESISPQENVKLDKMALAPCHAFMQFNIRALSLEERVCLCLIDIHATESHSEEYHNLMDTLGVPRYGLSCMSTIRSNDFYLGNPYNTASYALLTHMIANILGMIPDKLHISLGNVHLYKNHLDQAYELLSRDLELYPLPTLIIDKKYNSIDDFTMDSFKVEGYNSHQRIYAPIAI